MKTNQTNTKGGYRCNRRIDWKHADDQSRWNTGKIRDNKSNW